MRRFALTLAVLGLMAAVPANASAAGFSLGVAAADVSTSSAILWAHATSSGRTTLEVARIGSFGRLEKTKIVAASKSHDNTVQSKVTGLKAEYEVLLPVAAGHEEEQGRHVQDGAGGHLRRAGEVLLDRRRRRPAPEGLAEAVLQHVPGLQARAERAQRLQHQHGRHDLLRHRGRHDERPGCVHAGCAHGEDGRGQVGQVPPEPRAAPTWPTCAGRAAMYNHWDDHEFINDFTKAENGSAIYNAGVKAFRDYMPVTYSSSKGIYRSLPVGQEPRGVPARRALVPLGQGEREPPVR